MPIKPENESQILDDNWNCVCVWERQRERRGGILPDSHWYLVHYLPTKGEKKKASVQEFEI